MRTSSVYYGDCFKHLLQWNNWNHPEIFPNGTQRMAIDMRLADLIYLDPPWNSNANYNILWDKGKNKAKGHTAQAIAFTDIWYWGDAAADRLNRITKGHMSRNDPLYPVRKAKQSMSALSQFLPRKGMLAYLTYMAERLAFCHALLKETGSIYLHCDPTASHYLKMVMDDIFGAENFRNEIVWCYTGPSNTKRWFPRKHDYILFYTKLDEYRFNPDAIRVPYSEITMQRRSYSEGTKSIISPSAKTKGKRGREEAEAEFGQGKIPESWWTGISSGGQIPKQERRGYPTQKPLALLKRIIQASSNEGDVVLDPFCGCGPSLVAAHMLNRKFVGIDISLYSVGTVVKDWFHEIGLKKGEVKITGIPEDLASARQYAIEDPFGFERFAVELCHPGFTSHKVQRKDGGIDGHGNLLYPVLEDGKEKDLVLVQVKGGKNPPDINKVKAFAETIRSEGAIAGVFITVEKEHWTPAMKKVAKEAGKFKHPHSSTEYPRLQHWHIKRADLRAREETMFQGLPDLPEIAHPGTGKPLIPRQSDFDYWKPTKEEN